MLDSEVRDEKSRSRVFVRLVSLLACVFFGVFFVVVVVVVFFCFVFCNGLTVTLRLPSCDLKLILKGLVLNYLLCDISNDVNRYGQYRGFSVD